MDSFLPQSALVSRSLQIIDYHIGALYNEYLTEQ